MRTHERRIIAVATAALMLVATTSCDGGSDDPKVNKTSTATPITTSPTPPSESQQAADAASAILRSYFGVRNELRQNPDKALAALDSVATSKELAAQRNLFKRERKQGLHQVGQTKVTQLKVKSVNLDNTDPKAGMVPTVQIDLCFDVSEVDVLDAAGKSVISPDRPDTGWIQFLVSNYRWDEDPTTGWRVASSQDLERTPCEAS